MTAAIVDRRDLDVAVIPAPVGFLVLDAQVREMDLVIEVREIVLMRPFCDLIRLAIGASVSVVTIPIPLVQPLLVVALELVVEEDAIDACAALGEALGFAEVGSMNLGVVFYLARLLETRVELLTMVVAMVLPMVM